MTGESRSIWDRRARGSRGPAPERSLAEITATAIAIADAGGLAAVSMRQVATRLGTGPASLYRYVGGLGDLLDVMADTVTGQIDLSRPASGDWLGDMVTLVAEAKTVYLRHPWMVTLLSQRTPLGPNAIGYLESALTYLEQSSADGGTKLEAIAIVSGLTRLFAAEELRARDAPDDGRAAQESFLLRVAADGKHPHLRAALETRGPQKGSEFRRTIRRVLIGMLTSDEEEPHPTRE
ncbi:TetR/AcrR family transcriptional regulator [Promicromonospora sp. NPDC057138]|uniref:TetR/AcrR family transcriptional regulator n=1 Tax=Promicromonospora sp. NPDC057138 TaxID=3346031 RepID=UPI003634B8FD